MRKLPPSALWTVIFVCLSLLFQGCAMIPRYDRPAMPVPAAYKESAEAAAQPIQDIAWRDFFADEGMRRLIETALDNNRDLRTAMLNIEKARAQYRIQRADLLPTVAAAADASIQRLPGDLSRIGEAGINRQYSATLGFSSFELDLFGRIRSLTEEALETYYSVEDDAKTAQISLIAEVAGIYLQLVSDRELLDITRATYKSRGEQHGLIRKMFESGVASELEVSQARSLMEEARSNVARYETRVGQGENALTLLLGAPLPSDLPDARKLSQVRSLADIPEGLPSSLLERRPDIQAAEHRLKAANADIGAARANFFPTITLTGALGTISSDSAELFSGSAGYWSFLPSVSLPIFDTGRNISRLQASEAEKKIAVAGYEKSIQTAFREVADTLVQRSTISEQIAADKALVEATAKTHKLASTRYEAGVDNYLSVLDAQRSLYTAQQSYTATRLLRETNALTLYKALGGGWY